jgi:hypothetical protein
MVIGNKTLLFTQPILKAFNRRINHFFQPATLGTNKMIMMSVSKQVFISHRTVFDPQFPA